LEQEIMRKIILLCASLFAMVLSISASPVMAQNVLWVSNTGNDSNTCGATAPCATFQGAINKGNVVQINCLTSGTYGAVTITASLTIDCGTGNIGDVNVFTGNAITINASSVATIILRHLNLNGLGTSLGEGITTSSFPGGSLIVEDCMIHGFHDQNGGAMFFAPTGGRGLLQVSNSQFFDSSSGIVVAPASGQIASVTFNRVEVIGIGTNGVVLGGQGIVAGTMRDSIVGSNTGDGVLASASQVFFTVENSSVVANLSNGIQTNSAGSAIKVGASTIGANGTGIKVTSGSIVSFGDNHVSDNGVNGSFTTTAPLQ
jgi:Right handed beta helix region